MTIFERYVVRQAGSALLIILLSLSGIVWVALALRQLNVDTSQGQDVWMLVRMTTLALPNLMAIIAPFSLLIAAIHTLNRLNSDSEGFRISEGKFDHIWAQDITHRYGMAGGFDIAHVQRLQLLDIMNNITQTFRETFQLMIRHMNAG